MTLPAAAQEDLRWIVNRSADRAALMYGVKESDHSVIAFDCERATGEVAVSYAFEPVDAADGMKIAMELHSEGVRVTLPALGHRLELDDLFVLEARTSLTPELIRLLTRGTILTIMVQDGTEEIPLAGAADGVAALVETCALAPPRRRHHATDIRASML